MSNPETVNLAAMITGWGEALTMQGAPQIKIELLDEDFKLLQSGFWGGNRHNGRLAEIEINFPQGSKYNWRLRQVTAQADFSIETYWIPSVVRKLMEEVHGPMKASRASRTRAQFIKWVCSAVPEIRFHCKQLDVVQPISNKTSKTSSATAALEGGLARREAEHSKKAVGLTGKSASDLTVKGVPMTSQQREVADTLLRVADKKRAGAVPTEALIYAGIWESGLSESANNGSYWGVLSGSVSEWQQSATVQMAEAFLEGGGGFKGAIELAKKTSNPVQVAVEAEKPSVWPQNAYAEESGYPGDEAALAEVKKIVEAGGGATGTGGIEGGEREPVSQYNFEIGSSTEPHEDAWTGINRLAQEVNWELVVDGPDIYYDSDITLCRKPLVDVIDRRDERVANWEYDWDDRHIATNFTLLIVCGEWAYRPGDPIKTKGFGTATDGSTIGLPGRWLIGEIQREPGDIVATLTLVQPSKPLKEPATSTSSKAASGVGGSPLVGQFGSGTALAAVKAAQELSRLSLPYSEQYRTLEHKPPSEGYDCSSGVSWVLLTAGFPLPGGVTWGQWAPISTDFESWGEAGRGKEMTIWCNSIHIFIEFHAPTVGHVGFDSGHPSSTGVWYGPFGDEAYVREGESGVPFTPRHWKGT
ncbi:MAG: hypothetical protein ACYCSI_07320 [Solirubrobacteraceae bacterium]